MTEMDVPKPTAAKAPPEAKGAVVDGEEELQDITGGIESSLLAALNRSPATRAQAHLEEIDLVAGNLKVACVAELDEIKRVGLWSNAEYKAFRSGEWLWEEGDVGDCMWILLRGEVGVMKHIPDLNETKELVRLKAGASFGEVAFEMEDSRRAAGIQSLGEFPAHCLRIDEKQYRTIIKSVGGVSLDDRVGFLRKVGFLGEVPEPDLKRMALLMQESRLASGKVITRQGDPAEEMYFVVSGEARCVLSIKDKKERNKVTRIFNDHMDLRVKVNSLPSSPRARPQTQSPSTPTGRSSIPGGWAGGPNNGAPRLPSIFARSPYEGLPARRRTREGRSRTADDERQIPDPPDDIRRHSVQVDVASLSARNIRQEATSSGSSESGEVTGRSGSGPGRTGPGRSVVVSHLDVGPPAHLSDEEGDGDLPKLPQIATSPQNAPPKPTKKKPHPGVFRAAASGSPHMSPRTRKAQNGGASDSSVGSGERSPAGTTPAVATGTFVDIRELGKGDYFGEMGLVKHGARRACAVVTRTPCHLLVANRWDIRRAISQEAIEGIEKAAGEYVPIEEMSRELQKTLRWERYKADMMEGVFTQRQAKFAPRLW